MNLPIGQYRSKSVQAYAERVRSHDTMGSLKINIDINGVLSKRDPRVAEVIGQLVERKVAFMLYADAKNYAIIDPGKRMVVCYSDGKEATREVAGNDKQFSNRIKIAYVVYDKVYLPPVAEIERKETKIISHGGEVVSRLAHNQEADGSNPSRATKLISV